MRFKYNGRIYNPSNIEKKLKKMGITMEDIEILPDEIKKENENSLEDYMSDKEQVVVRSTKDNIRRICYVLKGTRPPFSTLFEKQRSIYDDEFLKTMYYDE